MISLSDLHELKTWFLIVVTDSGIFIITRDSQQLKVSSSSTVIDDGNVTLFNDVQFWNAFDPISVIVIGIFKLSSFLQPLNALLSIFVIDGGKIISFNSVFINAHVPILVIVGGICIVWISQLRNTFSPNFIPLWFNKSWKISSFLCL